MHYRLKFAMKSLLTITYLFSEKLNFLVHIQQVRLLVDWLPMIQINCIGGVANHAFEMRIFQLQ